MKVKLKLRKIGDSWGVIFKKSMIVEFIPGEEIELDIKIPDEKLIETLKSEIKTPEKEPKPISPNGENGLITLVAKDEHVGKKLVWDAKSGQNVWK